MKKFKFLATFMVLFMISFAVFGQGYTFVKTCATIHSGTPLDIVKVEVSWK